MRLLTIVAVLCCLSLTSAAISCEYMVYDPVAEVEIVPSREKTCKEGETKCHLQTTYPTRDGQVTERETWDCGPCVVSDDSADCHEWTH
jgi:hypothetical protein